MASKIFTPCTRFLGFFVCIVKSEVLDIGAAEHSWGDITTIKSGKISDISSDVSEKQSIIYTSACIESDKIEQYHTSKKLNDNC